MPKNITITIYYKDDCPVCDEVIADIVPFVNSRELSLILTKDVPSTVTALPAVLVTRKGYTEKGLDFEEVLLQGKSAIEANLFSTIDNNLIRREKIWPC